MPPLSSHVALGVPVPFILKHPLKVYCTVTFGGFGLFINKTLHYFAQQYHFKSLFNPFCPTLQLYIYLSLCRVIRDESEMLVQLLSVGLLKLKLLSLCWKNEEKGNFERK